MWALRSAAALASLALHFRCSRNNPMLMTNFVVNCAVLQLDQLARKLRLLLEIEERFIAEYEDRPGEIKANVYRTVMDESVGRTDGGFFYEWPYSCPAHIYIEEIREGGQRVVDTYQGKEPYYTIKEYFTVPYERQELAKANSLALRALNKVDRIVKGLEESGDDKALAIWMKEMAENAAEAYIREDYTAAESYADDLLVKACEVLDNPLRVFIDGDDSDWTDMNPVCIDPNGDVLNNKPPYEQTSTHLTMDIKAIYAMNDNEDLYLMIEFFDNNPELELGISFDTDLNGVEDRVLVTQAYGEVELDMVTRTLHEISHRTIGRVKCAYGMVVEVEIPLEMIGNPGIIGIEIASIDTGQDLTLDICGDEEVKLDIY